MEQWDYFISLWINISHHRWNRKAKERLIIKQHITQNIFYIFMASNKKSCRRHTRTHTAIIMLRLCCLGRSSSNYVADRLMGLKDVKVPLMSSLEVWIHRAATFLWRRALMEQQRMLSLLLHEFLLPSVWQKDKTKYWNKGVIKVQIHILFVLIFRTTGDHRNSDLMSQHLQLCHISLGQIPL